MGLSPDTRAYIQAYADGLNFYAATHPEAVDERVLPVTGQGRGCGLYAAPSDVLWIRWRGPRGNG